MTDPANDVAILKPHLLDGIHPAINLSALPPELGESILTLGYPAPEELGASLKVTSGTINALSGKDASSQRIDDVRFLQVSSPVQSGNSGGPALDNSGNAVGIIISKLQMTSKDEIAENIKYALKIRYVEGLLGELPNIGGVMITENSISAVESIAKHQQSVFLITAVRWVVAIELLRYAAIDKTFEATAISASIVLLALILSACETSPAPGSGCRLR